MNFDSWIFFYLLALAYSLSFLRLYCSHLNPGHTWSSPNLFTGSSIKKPSFYKDHCWVNCSISRCLWKQSICVWEWNLRIKYNWYLALDGKHWQQCKQSMETCWWCNFNLRVPFPNFSSLCENRVTMLFMLSE